MSTFDKQKFGQRLKEMRLKAGYERQIDLAKKLGTVVQTISNYESGSRLPDAEMLARIVEVLPCNADYLLGFEDKPTYAEAYIADQTGLSSLSIEYLRQYQADCKNHTEDLDFGMYAIELINIFIQDSRFESLVQWYTELFRSLYADYKRHSNKAASDEYWEQANEAMQNGYILVEPTEAIDLYIRRIGDFASMAVRDGLVRKVAELCGLDENVLLNQE